jgi:L-ascorbate metabolism protein UlaG (beta-lactamase superfamily)
MELTYHGYASFELTDNSGTTLLIDPWIDDNPHCNRSVESFNDVSAIFVTHGAFDHLGDAPQIAEANDAEIYCDFATMIHLINKEEFRNDLVNGYIWGMEISGDNWSTKVVEAHHLSMFWRDGLIGPALGFIISFDGERVYHMGDTSIFRDIELFGDLYDPTISLIPVGKVEGYLTELHPEEAALAADWLGSETTIPMHYTPDSDNPKQFEDLCQARGVTEETDVRRLEPGHSADF